MFEVNIPTFLGLSDKFAGNYSSKNDSNEITGKELLNILQGGSGGIYAKSFPTGITGVLQSNLKRNWMMMAGQVIGIPIAAKMAKKILRKPVLTPANRLLKTAGLSNLKV